MITSIEPDHDKVWGQWGIIHVPDKGEEPRSHEPIVSKVELQEFITTEVKAGNGKKWRVHVCTHRPHGKVTQSCVPGPFIEEFPVPLREEMKDVQSYQLTEAAWFIDHPPKDIGGL